MEGRIIRNLGKNVYMPNDISFSIDIKIPELKQLLSGCFDIGETYNINEGDFHINVGIKSLNVRETDRKEKIKDLINFLEKNIE